MDEYTFYSSLVKYLAWPITSLIIVFTLLFNLEEIARIVESVSYKDGAIKFRKRLDKLDRGIEVLQQEDSSSSNTVPMNPELIDLAEKVDPRFAIIEGWRHLENDISELFKSKVGDAKSKGSQFKARELMQKEVITKDEYEIIRQLRELRNIAVHSNDEISLGEAYQFIQNLAYITKFLSRRSNLKAA